MAKTWLQPVTDDGAEGVNTAFYEIWYKPTANTLWVETSQTSPLSEFTLTTSPAGMYPCIIVTPLADDTVYDLKVRRFDHDGNYSDWTITTFNTGIPS